MLVRHGLSSFNTEHRVQGRDDASSLTPEGHQQARSVGQALKELRFDHVYTSPLSRASATADSLLADHGQGLTAEASDDLLEIDLEPWSGLLRPEIQERFPEQERQWRQAPEALVLEHKIGRAHV